MNNLIRVLGTCHHDTKGFKTADLYDCLCQVKPDVILFETPIDDEVSMMDWLKACENHYQKRGGGESAAVLHYLEDHEVQVLPYDLKGRNDYFRKKHFFEQEAAYGKVHNAYFKQPNANPTAAYLNNLTTNMRRKFGYFEYADKHTLSDINSTLCDTEVETYISINNQITRAIFNLVPEFAAYQKDFWSRYNFHARRDKAMVKNILNYNKQFEGKTIVVICGYFHRYALVKMLKMKQSKAGFILKA
jgi:hypothetical protein